ncbi:unnamed protein product [Withania somnifera]
MVFSMVMSCSPNLYLRRSRMVMQKTIRCFSSSSVSTPPESVKFDLKTYWATLISDINQKLDEAVPVKYPNQIYEAMSYSVLAKGAKRPPPIMCVAACELFGGNRLAAFPTACALEMTRSACKPHSFWCRYGNFSGGCLVPYWFPAYCVPHSQVISFVLRVISEIARAVGSTGMAAGQFIDLEGGPNAVEFVQEKKYGEMGECSAVCGGLLGGASDEEIQHLRKYGRAVGVLYRFADDILEAKKTEDETKGKKKKSKSYVRVYGVEKAMKVAEDLRAQAKRELDGFKKYGDKVVPLNSFIDYAADRGFSIDGQV